MELPATVMSGFCLLGIFVLLSGGPPPAHCLASAHFSPEISLEVCERPGERYHVRLRTVLIPSPFHPTGVCLFRSEFGSTTCLQSLRP